MKIRTTALAQAISDEMLRRKRRMKKLEADRYEEVCFRVPEIRQLDSDIKAMTFDLGRSLMGSGSQKNIYDSAEMLIADYDAQKHRKLVENGFPADYLDHQYVCRDCRDTGRIGDELCRCVNQLAINILFEDSGLDPKQCFEAFDLDLQRTPSERNAMSKIRDAAICYAQNFPDNEKRDLLYIGEPGVGKTFLVNCIGGAVLKRGYSVLKISSNKLIQLTLDTLRADPSEKPDFIFPDLLIIDDLGTEPMIPNITIETLLSILCQRQDSGKATIVATNLDARASEQNPQETIWSIYSERFASRLIAPRTVKIQTIHTTNVRLVQR